MSCGKEGVEMSARQQTAFAGGAYETGRRNQEAPFLQVQ